MAIDKIVHEIQNQPIEEALKFAVSGIRDPYSPLMNRIHLIEAIVKERYGDDKELNQIIRDVINDAEQMNERIAILLLDVFMKRIQCEL